MRVYKNIICADNNDEKDMQTLFNKFVDFSLKEGFKISVKLPLSYMISEGKGVRRSYNDAVKLYSGCIQRKHKESLNSALYESLDNCNYQSLEQLIADYDMPLSMVNGLIDAVSDSKELKELLIIRGYKLPIVTQTENLLDKFLPDTDVKKMVTDYAGISHLYTAKNSEAALLDKHLPVRDVNKIVIDYTGIRADKGTNCLFLYKHSKVPDSIVEKYRKAFAKAKEKVYQEPTLLERSYR